MAKRFISSIRNASSFFFSIGERGLFPVCFLSSKVWGLCIGVTFIIMMKGEFCVCAIFLLLCRLFLSPFDFLELDVPVERQYITPLCVFSFEN